MAEHLVRRRRLVSLTLERGVEGVVGFMARHPFLFWLLAMWVVIAVWSQFDGSRDERELPGNAVFVCDVVPEACSTPTTASF